MSAGSVTQSPASRRSEAADLRRPCGQHLPSGHQGTEKHPGRPGDAGAGRLLLQHLRQHGRHRRGDGGDQPLGRHRRRGRLGPVAADRRGAAAADLPAAGADHRVRHRPDDGPGQAPVRRRDPAEFRGRRSRPAQDRHPDQRRRDRGRPGRQWRQLSAQRHRQRDPAVHLRAGRLDRRADQSRRARRVQPEPQDLVVLGDDPGHQPDHAC